MPLDFTFEKYKQLCYTIIGSGYKVLMVKEYLETKDESKKTCILRHDVDRKPLNALKMALLEKDLNISTTYYFRKRKNTFKPNSLKNKLKYDSNCSLTIS